MQLVDSHCHLDLLDLSPEDLSATIATARKENVCHILCVAVTLNDFPRVLKIAQEYDFVSASLGLHPNEIVENEPSVETLIDLGSHKKVVAIGETGLDYFRSTGDTKWQRERFIHHIEAAKKLNKPLIIHTRQAKEDTLQIMKNEQVEKCGGVMHCFTEDWLTAKAALDLNFYISFSGIVTFKSAKEIQEVAKKIPLDRMLIETDSPYLAPNPHRGKPNQPAFVKYVANFIAELRGIPLDELGLQTTQNFFTLFSQAHQS